MKLIYGNVFEQESTDAICITTNGYVKCNGEAVCGRGCALEASREYPDFAKQLGRCIELHGNRVQVIMPIRASSYLVSFPVKPRSIVMRRDTSVIVRHMRLQFEPGDIVPGWAVKANIKLIERSVRQLIKLTDRHGWKRVMLPRPGCGAGELDWQDVKPLLRPLDDRFFVITLKR
jgi:hypothetical protein